MHVYMYVYMYMYVSMSMYMYVGIRNARRQMNVLGQRNMRKQQEPPEPGCPQNLETCWVAVVPGLAYQGVHRGGVLRHPDYVK
jgi:hypothetical protein